MSKRGWLIVFEGIDGTGKSTQCSKMEEYLNSKGVLAVRFREPTNGVWGKKIRHILKVGRGKTTREEELSWFNKDRQDDVEKNILPALNENKVVLSWDFSEANDISHYNIYKNRLCSYYLLIDWIPL